MACRRTLIAGASYTSWPAHGDAADPQTSKHQERMQRQGQVGFKNRMIRGFTGGDLEAERFAEHLLPLREMSPNPSR